MPSSTVTLQIILIRLFAGEHEGTLMIRTTVWGSSGH